MMMRKKPMNGDEKYIFSVEIEYSSIWKMYTINKWKMTEKKIKYFKKYNENHEKTRVKIWSFCLAQIFDFGIEWKSFSVGNQIWLFFINKTSTKKKNTPKKEKLKIKILVKEKKIKEWGKFKKKNEFFYSVRWTHFFF